MAIHNLTHKGFAGSHDISLEDGCLIGRILFIDDIISYEGETVAELKVNFEAAVDRYLAYCKSTGKPANKPYSGTFNVRVGSETHRKAVEAAHAAGMNLNEYVFAAVTRALTEHGTTNVEHNHHHLITIENEAMAQSHWAAMVTSQVLERFSANTI